jgi:hypothetical protein
MILNLRSTAVKITGSKLSIKAGEKKNVIFGLKPLTGLLLFHILRRPVWGTIRLGKVGNCSCKERVYQT